MADTIILNQGDPVVVLNDTPTPTIVPSSDTQSIVLNDNGAVFQVTQTIQPEDPGDLTLVFDNKLI